MIREYLLQQNAFNDVDAYSAMDQQYAMAKAILTFKPPPRRRWQGVRSWMTS